MGSGVTEWRQAAGNFVGRHPLFVASIMAVGVVLLASVSLGWAAVWTVAAVGGGYFLGKWKLAAAWLVCAAVACGVFLARSQQRDRDEREMLRHASLTLRARVVGDPRGEDGRWSAPAVVLSGPHEGAKVWWQGEGVAPVKGSILQSSGKPLELAEPRNPGEFDRASWLRHQGVASLFLADSSLTRMETGPMAGWAARMKNGFREAVTDGLENHPEAAKVVKAVVIGEISPDSDELIAAYRNSGTLHVFSVSGLHVAMAASIAWFVLRWCRVRRRWALIGLIGVVFGYSWITGNSPPALRSAWMTAVFLMAFVLRRKGDLLNSLGAVLLVGMLWDGRLIFQPGVQLSYGVVAAIAVGVKFTERFFDPMAQPELYLPVTLMSRRQKLWLGFRRKTAQYFSVSTAAWAGSTPLTIWHFGVVTPVSILAGLLVLPAVYLLLVVGLLSAFLHPVARPLSRGLNQVNGQLADLTTRMAAGFSSIPGGHFSVAREAEPFLLVYDLKYGAGAACFSSGDGSGLLMDAGDRVGFKSRIAPSLRAQDIMPDSVALSHPDGGHVGGGEKIWESFPLRQAVIPVERSRSPGYKVWLDQAPTGGVRLILAEKGQRFPLADGSWLEVLHHPDPQAVNAEADERVAVYRLHWRGWRILFTSDAGTDTERKMLGEGGDIGADLIICGRPKHDTNLSDGFLSAVSPRAIVASNAAFPYQEKLPPAQVAYWKSRGIQVMDQQVAGGVTIRVDESGSMILTGFVDHSKIRLRQR